MESVTVYIANAFNNLTLGDFSAIELNLLMAILVKVHERGEKTLTFSFSDLRKLAHITNANSKKRFAELANDFYVDLISTVSNISDTDPEYFNNVNLFDYFICDPDQSILKVRINPKYIDLFYNMTSNYYKFDLDEFCGIKSKYAKNLYRLLKQFDNQLSCWYKKDIMDLKLLIGCPHDMPNNTFSDKIIVPSAKKLEDIFGPITITKDYGHQRGNAIRMVKFEWERKSSIENNL